jgi:hypothetical protein
MHSVRQANGLDVNNQGLPDRPTTHGGDPGEWACRRVRSADMYVQRAGGCLTCPGFAGARIW